MTPISEARKRANQNYIDKQDEIKIRVVKGRKAEIQAHADRQGESINGFVNRAIEEAMQRDQGGQAPAQRRYFDEEGNPRPDYWDEEDEEAYKMGAI